ncbi:F1F0 ATP synthase subunit e, mitochondrial [Taxawa tesnikishii (nom. ined.)]|nr:F1F0 ATP synthase subunit e, mitochondrial [Dothideales sp. JES 119]
MASTGVFRWSALGLGIFYGFYHQSTISASEKLAQINADYERKTRLIEQAKGIISDPEDPNFDLEKYLISKSQSA